MPSMYIVLFNFELLHLHQMILAKSSSTPTLMAGPARVAVNHRQDPARRPLNEMYIR